MTGTSVKSPMSGTVTSVTAAPVRRSREHPREVRAMKRAASAPSITRWS